MAGNSALNLEDQSDEDFFDKLGNDDDAELLVTPSAQISSNRSDSIEIKAFTKPSLDNSECKTGTVCKEVDGLYVAGHVEERNSSLASGKSADFDSVSQTENDNPKAVVNLGGNIGSAGAGVKEVQWSAFNVKSEQIACNNSVGSYLDFYSELKDGADDPVENMESNAHESNTGDFSGEINSMDDVNRCTTSSDSQDHSASVAGADQHDLNSTQYWESMYPGWKYDLSTGQWYQVDKNDIVGDNHAISDDTVLDTETKTGVSSHLQQTTHYVLETISENGKLDYTSVNTSNETSENILNWNQVTEGNNGYPAHMVFDPQYPGWYYDMITKEWHTLESYPSFVQPSIQAHGQPIQNGYGSNLTVLQNGDRSEASNGYNWNESYGNYNQQGSNTGTSGIGPKDQEPTTFSGNNQTQIHFVSDLAFNHHFSNNSTSMVPLHEKESLGSLHLLSDFSSATVSQGSHYGVNLSQQQNGQIHASHYSQEQFQSIPEFSHPNVGRSSAGRPMHALVTFGFGGKLIVMKNTNNSSFSTSSYGGQQDSIGSSVSVHSLIEIISDRHDAPCIGVGCYDYLDVLCRQSFPGPLAGGSISNKEVNRWIEERIANCESHDVNYRKSSGLRSLLSLLKIAFQHYGNLRPPFGSESALREGDVPETAVAMLFASLKKNDVQLENHPVLTHCIRKLPSEEQIQATAAQVQSLLVFGKKKEALQCAIEGQLWSIALVLAAQTGDQTYMDTVKQMAFHQLVPGSPLRTICLLIAGQLAYVFSTDSPADSSIHAPVNMSPKCNTNSILDNWEDNLAVISANRTKDDELVLLHLGDCLWKDRSDIVAAHSCYILAEAKFEPYSDTSRFCLVGSDHWRFPRTYASPEAIQRTELYEYSKVLGNPQFTLLPFQPYKLIYAHMLAEVGKLSEALKYCQAVSKLLRTGRSPEVETWKQIVSALEERIRTHHQGGYTANLAPGKLVGKLLNLFDSTAHRVKGGKLPPIPSPSRGNSLSNNDHHDKKLGHRAFTSQSSMAMSSLVPSDSVEHMSEWTGDRKAYSRSISEPDFRRTTPREGHTESPNEPTTSRFSHLGRFSFGSQILQKTMGLVLKPRQERQAKLGETNKFYYDEKLKRWVEEGAEVPTEEAALPPPPPTVAFQNGVSNYSLSGALGSATNGSLEFRSPVEKNSSASNSIPPATNHFSAHRRTGVNSRYVDTFNKGGENSRNLYQSACTPPSVKSASVGNPKFFVPTPVTSGKEESHHDTGFPNNGHEEMVSNENSIPFSSQSNPTYNSHLYQAEVKPSGQQQTLTMSPPSANIQTNVGSFGHELYEVEI